MKTGIRAFVAPMVLVIIGVAWLVSSMGYETSIVHWLIAGGLIFVGVGTITAGGINRQTMVTGPILIMLGVMWLLYSQFGVAGKFLMPCGVIGLGLILAISRMPNVPENALPDDHMDRKEGRFQNS